MRSTNGVGMETDSEAPISFPAPSAAIPSPRLEVLSEEVIQPKRRQNARLPSQPEPAAPPAEPSKPTAPATPQRDSSRLWGALGAFQAIAMILSARAILLLAAAGSLALGFHTNDWLGFAVLMGYNSLVILPLTWLDYTSRRGQ